MHQTVVGVFLDPQQIHQAQEKLENFRNESGCPIEFENPHNSEAWVRSDSLFRENCRYLLSLLGDWSLSEEDADRFVDEIQKGTYILKVKTPDEKSHQVMAILGECGAVLSKSDAPLSEGI